MPDFQIVNTFLDIAKKLNKEGIHPIVYGSLGLYLILGNKNNMKDIDFIINKPEDFLTCKEVLLKNGFRIDPDHERELVMGNVYVSFIDKEDIEKLIEEPLKLESASLNNVNFFNISPEQHLKIYKIGLQGKYRKEKKERDDLEKIKEIEEYLK